MAITLTITDNADGTGATATVAGSGVGTANVVTVGKATGLTGPLSFVAGGSRTGDGAVTLAVAGGLWWALLKTDGAFSALAYFSASDGAAAVATRVRRAVCDTLRLLTIQPAERVYEQAFPDPKNVTFPCILATVDGVQESDEQALSTRDDVGRPVKVQIFDRRSKNDHARLPTWETWRQAAERCFRNQQLAGVPESVRCKIEPYVILDPNLPAFEHMASGFVVRAICREPRGVGV